MDRSENHQKAQPLNDSKVLDNLAKSQQALATYDLVVKQNSQMQKEAHDMKKYIYFLQDEIEDLRKQVYENAIEIPDYLFEYGENLYLVFKSEKKRMLIANFTLKERTVYATRLFAGNALVLKLIFITQRGMEVEVMLTMEELLSKNLYETFIRAGLFFYSTRSYSEECITKLFRKYLLNSPKGGGTITLEVRGGWRYTDNGWKYGGNQDVIDAIFGYKTPIKAFKQAAANSKLDLKLAFQAIRNKELLVISICLPMYAIVEGFLPPHLRLCRIINLTNNLLLAKDISVCMMRIMNRGWEVCDLNVLDDEKTISEKLFYIKDEIVIIGDMERAISRNQIYKHAKNINLIKKYFCDKNADFGVTGVCVLISNNADAVLNRIESEPQTESNALLVLNVDRMAIYADDFDKLKSGDDKIADFFSKFTAYFSSMCMNFANEMMDFYDSRTNSPDYEDFTMADLKKYAIIFEKLLIIFDKFYEMETGESFNTETLLMPHVKKWLLQQQSMDVEGYDEIDDIYYLLQDSLLDYIKTLGSNVCDIKEFEYDENAIFFDKKYICIPETFFKNCLCAGINKNLNPMAALKVLREANVLDVNNGEKGYTSKVQFINDKKRRSVIRLKRSFVEELGDVPDLI